jgi:hypothetical protein
MRAHTWEQFALGFTFQQKAIDFQGNNWRTAEAIFLKSDLFPLTPTI